MHYGPHRPKVVHTRPMPNVVVPCSSNGMGCQLGSNTAHALCGSGHVSCNYAGHMPAHLTRAKFSGLVDPTRPGLHGSRTPCVWTGFIGFDVLASALNSFRPYALYAFSANLAELLKMTNQNPFLSWCRH
jgi:hypothetical protein